MAKKTSASHNVSQEIIGLRKYKIWWIGQQSRHEAENKRLSEFPEIKNRIRILEDKIKKVRQATMSKTIEKNFDNLLITLMKTAYELSKSTRPRLKTQIGSLKQKILLDIACGYANEAKKKSKK